MVNTDHDERAPGVYPPVLNFVLYFLFVPVTLGVWYSAWWPLVPLFWLAMAHLGHTVLIAFHEAVHFNLATNRRMNEIRGFMTGAVSLIPLSVYRQLHGYHHAALATERDMELWPYTVTTVPRWLRILAAWTELTLGFFFTPLAFLHGILTARDVPPEVRRRIRIEYAICLSMWAAGLSLVHWFGWWEQFLVAYMAPAMLAGNLQTLRKFTEHMGLFGDGPLTATRTVVHKRPLGRLLSTTMLYVSHHGTHHRYGKLPYHKLPSATPRAFEPGVEPGPLFATYSSAFRDMLPSLLNPRIGKQWLLAREAQAVEQGQTVGTR